MMMMMMIVHTHGVFSERYERQLSMKVIETIRQNCAVLSACGPKL